MLVAPIAVEVDVLPTVNAESDTFVSTCTALTWFIARPSSSAAIIRTAVGVPCPSSVQPWNNVTVLSGFTCSHESICVASGGPGKAPVCNAEVAAGSFAARAPFTATPVRPRPITRAPPPLRNDLRESSASERSLAAGCAPVAGSGVVAALITHPVPILIRGYFPSLRFAITSIPLSQ